LTATFAYVYDWQKATKQGGMDYALPILTRFESAARNLWPGEEAPAARHGDLISGPEAAFVFGTGCKLWWTTHARIANTIVGCVAYLVVVHDITRSQAFALRTKVKVAGFVGLVELGPAQVAYAVDHLPALDLRTAGSFRTIHER
jgi:hypothetical protein